MVPGEEANGGHALKPIKETLLQIAHGHELGAHGHVVQHKPAAERAGGFAPHQAAADDSQPHCRFAFQHARDFAQGARRWLVIFEETQSVVGAKR